MNNNKIIILLFFPREFHGEICGTPYYLCYEHLIYNCTHTFTHNIQYLLRHVVQCIILTKLEFVYLRSCIAFTDCQSATTNSFRSQYYFYRIANYTHTTHTNAQGQQTDKQNINMVENEKKESQYTHLDSIETLCVVCVSVYCVYVSFPKCFCFIINRLNNDSPQRSINNGCLTIIIVMSMTYETAIVDSLLYRSFPFVPDCQSLCILWNYKIFSIFLSLSLFLFLLFIITASNAFDRLFAVNIQMRFVSIRGILAAQNLICNERQLPRVEFQ